MAFTQSAASLGQQGPNNLDETVLCIRVSAMLSSMKVVGISKVQRTRMSRGTISLRLMTALTNKLLAVMILSDIRGDMAS